MASTAYLNARASIGAVEFVAERPITWRVYLREFLQFSVRI